MTGAGWLPAPIEDIFGPEATAEESYDVLTVDVPATGWIAALRVARDDLGCTFFDWLSAVDEPDTGMRVSAHVVALSPVRRLLLRTTVPHDAPVLPSAVDVYAGAAWHERETHEMFGVTFEGHPALDHLLLPDGFEGHPLRKDFVLAARVAKAWPGAKEPGESDHGGPKRRQMLPPGVPDPNEWGPLKGQLPPAPARTARAAGRPAGDRPARRTRTAAEGSATQAPAASETTQTPTPPRRVRSASEGSASQRAAEAGAGQAAAPAGPAAGPRRTRSASGGSASQRAAASEAQGQGPVTEPPAAPRSSDAPWHHARPAFDESEPTPSPERQSKADTEDTAEGKAAAGTAAEAGAVPEAEAGPKAEGETGPETKAEAETTTVPDSEARPEDQAAPEAETRPEDQAAPEAETRPEDQAAPEARAGTAGGETRRDDGPPSESSSPDPDETPTPDDPSGGTR